MLERMIGALMFRPETYEEVESDPSAISQALSIVLLVTVCGIIGGLLGDILSPPSYARFYTFTLDQPKVVQIDLLSPENTYLYLYQGTGADATELDKNDNADIRDFNSRITSDMLPAGTYTVEATTKDAGKTGNFSLTIALADRSQQPALMSASAACAMSLGALSGGVSLEGTWSKDCESSQSKGLTGTGLILGVVGGLFFGILRWAMWVTLLLMIGGGLLRSAHTQTNWAELGRVVGFAYTPGVLSILSFIPNIGWLFPVIAFFWTLWGVVVAVRHAMDFDSTGRALAVVLITAVLGVIPWIIIKVIEFIVIFVI
jgi:hypothetical protein